MKTVAHHTMRWSLLLVFSFLVLVAITTGAARISLPFAGNYRAEIQSYVSNYLGNPVEIGSLDLNWSGTGPRLVLSDIVLVSGAERQQDLHFEEILLDLDLLRSWLNGSWKIREMALVGVNLSIEHLSKNQFRVYGYQIDPQKRNSDSNLNVLGWLTNADRVALVDSRLHIIDRSSNIHLDLRNLNILAANDSGQHRIRLDTDIHALSPDKIRLAVDFEGNTDNLRLSSGSFQLKTENLDIDYLAGLLPPVTELAFSGQADAEVWGKWSEASLQSIRLVSEAESLGISNAGADRHWKSERGNVDLVVRKKERQYQLAIQDFSWSAGDDVVKKFGGNLTISPDRPRHFHANMSGPMINLTSLSDFVSVFEGSHVLGKLPEISAIINPAGKIKNWNARLISKPDSPMSISLRSDLQAVSFGPYKKLPGFRDIDGVLQVRESVGELIIKEDSLALLMPRWFRNDIEMDSVSGSLAFRFGEGEIEMQSSTLSISNSHMKGGGEFHFAKKQGEPGWLDVEARVEQGDGQFAHLYYPAGRMHPDLVEWLDSSIKGGTIRNGTFSLHGPIKNFPFKDGNGVFNAGFDVRNGKIRYLPKWPVLNLLNANVQFQPDSMRVSGQQAQAAGNELSGVNISIDGFKNAVVDVSGKSVGTASRLLQFVYQSPLQEILDPVIRDSVITGPVGLEFGLQAPLKNFSPDKLKLNGRMDLAGNRWQSTPFGFDLHEMSGTFSFTQNSLSSNGIQAEFLGSPVTIKALADPNDPQLFTRLTANGEMPASNILRNYAIPVDYWFSGISPWQVELTARRSAAKENAMNLDLKASSDMVGTAVALPQPYGIDSGESLPVVVSTRFIPDQSDTFWNFRYGDRITGKVRVPASSARPDALLFGLGKDLPADALVNPGIYIQGEAPELAFDQWIATLSELIDRLPEAETPEKLQPLDVTISTKNLRVGKINTGPARLRGGSNDEHIIAGMASRWLSGDLHYPRRYWDRTKPLSANLFLLDKQFLDALGTSDGDESRLDPSSFPPLDISIKRFVWDDFNVADLELESMPVADGMMIETLGFDHEHLQMTGYAHWRTDEAVNSPISEAKKHRTDLSLTLISDDTGKGMENIGIGGAFAGGDGQASITLGWDDAAYAPAFDEIEGDVELSFSEGRVLAVEPGAARILGLFAFQTVPRRLLLDFEDVTKDGLRYDTIEGRMSIGNGIAETQYMQMQGPIGVVFSKGSTDFVGNTYDQTITVLPRLSATLPIIGLLSAGATAGVGVLVIDQVLKGLGVNFDEIGKQEYRLTGSWDDPQLERIVAAQSSNQNDR